MTWIRITREGGYRFSTARLTRYFDEGDHKNVPRYMANKIEADGAGVKEVKKREKARANTPNIPAAD